MMIDHHNEYADDLYEYLVRFDDLRRETAQCAEARHALGAALDEARALLAGSVLRASMGLDEEQMVDWLDEIGRTRQQAVPA